MIKKGIILAGGMGTRMSPLTKAVNKQLLPIYDKPLIFYPLSILMLAKIKDVLIIVNKGQLEQYKKIIPNGERLGINIQYKEQDEPRGLPDAFILGEKFINNQNVAMILGDNFFYGQSLSTMLNNCIKLDNGAKIILHKVLDPEKFGVAKIMKKKIISIKEKPKKFFSDLAIIVAISKTKNDVKIKINVTDVFTCLENPTLILAHNLIGHVVSFPIKNKVINVSSKEIVKAKRPAIISDNFIFGNRTYQKAWNLLAPRS